MAEHYLCQRQRLKDHSVAGLVIKKPALHWLPRLELRVSLDQSLSLCILIGVPSDTWKRDIDHVIVFRRLGNGGKQAKGCPALAPGTLDFLNDHHVRAELVDQPLRKESRSRAVLSSLAGHLPIHQRLP